MAYLLPIASSNEYTAKILLVLADSFLQLGRLEGVLPGNGQRLGTDLLSIQMRRSTLDALSFFSRVPAQPF